MLIARCLERYGADAVMPPEAPDMLLPARCYYRKARQEARCDALDGAAA